MRIGEIEKYISDHNICDNLSQFCRLLGLNKQNHTMWKQIGYIPLLQQYRIAEFLDGALMPDDEDPAVLKRKLSGKKYWVRTKKKDNDECSATAT